MRAFTGGRSAETRDETGKEILCAHCSLVDHPGFKAGLLSPVPPAFKAEGKTYAHGLDQENLQSMIRSS